MGISHIILNRDTSYCTNQLYYNDGHNMFEDLDKLRLAIGMDEVLFVSSLRCCLNCAW